MVILLQLCIFLVAALMRLRTLFGQHLEQNDEIVGALRFVSTNKGRITARHIGIECRNGYVFNVRPERWYHRMLKSLGLATEISLADDVLNRKIFISTDYPGHFDNRTRNALLTEGLKKLFELPIRALYATKDRIWCILKKEAYEDPPFEYTRALQSISDILEQQPNDPVVQNQVQRNAFLALGAIAIHMGLLGFGLLGALPTLADSIDTPDAHGLAVRGALAGEAAALIWLLVLLALLRGTSWICWVLADFALSAVLGFGLSGIWVLRDLNIDMSQPPAQTFTLQAQQKTCSLKCSKRCGRHCTRRSEYTFYNRLCEPSQRYFLRMEKIETDPICRSSAHYEYAIQVEPWAGTKPYVFTSGEALFDQVKVDANLQIPVHPGALSFEWIDLDAITPE